MNRTSSSASRFLFVTISQPKKRQRLFLWVTGGLTRKKKDCKRGNSRKESQDCAKWHLLTVLNVWIAHVEKWGRPHTSKIILDYFSLRQCSGAKFPRFFANFIFKVKVKINVLKNQGRWFCSCRRCKCKCNPPILKSAQFLTWRKSHRVCHISCFSFEKKCNAPLCNLREDANNGRQCPWKIAIVLHKATCATDPETFAKLKVQLTFRFSYKRVLHTVH